LKFLRSRRFIGASESKPADLNRKPNHRGKPLATGAILKPDSRPVRTDDLPHDSEAQPATLLRRSPEKRLKNAIADIRWNTGAIIRHGKHNGLVTPLDQQRYVP
jgi:hypothetical protein